MHINTSCDALLLYVLVMYMYMRAFYLASKIKMISIVVMHKKGIGIYARHIMYYYIHFESTCALAFKTVFVPTWMYSADHKLLFWLK